jgi:uncharacterized membrane protein YqaE (UPF0057 family)
MGHKTRKGVLYTTAFFVPPLAVYLKHGTNKHFGLNVLLTLLGWYVVLLTHPSGSSRPFAVALYAVKMIGASMEHGIRRFANLWVIDE